MKSNYLFHVLFSSLLITGIAGWSPTAAANGSPREFATIFPLAGVPGYPPEAMIANCGGAFEDASARLFLHQRNGTTWVFVNVRNAVPSTFWTVWVRMERPSPLTNAPVMALANPSDIAALASATPDASLTAAAKAIALVGDDGSGSTTLANGFWTNAVGHGWFGIRLDYPLVRGAFQFTEFHESLARVAIGNAPNAPFALRVASHCEDQVGHGLVPGKHEMWFDWSWE